MKTPKPVHRAVQYLPLFLHRSRLKSRGSSRTSTSARMTTKRRISGIENPSMRSYNSKRRDTDAKLWPCASLSLPQPDLSAALTNPLLLIFLYPPSQEAVPPPLKMSRPSPVRATPVQTSSPSSAGPPSAAATARGKRFSITRSSTLPTFSFRVFYGFNPAYVLR
jgi:hypothetical protein